MDDERTIENLLADLDSEDPVTRALAVDALAALRDPNTIEALKWLMGDESLWVRCNAAEALGEFRDETVVSPLVAFLRLGAETELAQVGRPQTEPLRFHRFSRQPDPVFTAWLDSQGVAAAAQDGLNLAVSARLALQKVGILATDALVCLLDDDNPYTRYVAGHLLNAMCMRKKPQAALVAALQSGPGRVRQRAALALGRLGNFAVVGPLTDALDDSDERVIAAAVEALGAVGGGQARLALEVLRERNDRMRAAVWAALSGMGSQDL